MHRAAHTFVEAGFSAENLSERTINQEISCQILDTAIGIFFNNLEAFAAKIVFHDLHQCLVIKLFNR